MTKKILCAVDGCSKPKKGRGYCAMHYRRLMTHGDLNIVNKAASGAALAFVMDVAMNCKSDECLTWPFGRSYGYGSMCYEGKTVIASRFICELANGPSPLKHDAAHSCGNGHLACVNPRHLSWKTRSENIEDMRAHGTLRIGEKNPMSKLRHADVIKIFELKGTETHQTIADRFGVARSVVSRILSGRRWKHVFDSH